MNVNVNQQQYKNLLEILREADPAIHSDIVNFILFSKPNDNTETKLYKLMKIKGIEPEKFTFLDQIYQKIPRPPLNQNFPNNADSKTKSISKLMQDIKNRKNELRKYISLYRLESRLEYQKKQLKKKESQIVILPTEIEQIIRKRINELESEISEIKKNISNLTAQILSRNSNDQNPYRSLGITPKQINQLLLQEYKNLKKYKKKLVELGLPPAPPAPPTVTSNIPPVLNLPPAPPTLTSNIPPAPPTPTPNFPATPPRHSPPPTSLPHTPAGPSSSAGPSSPLRTIFQGPSSPLNNNFQGNNNFRNNTRSEGKKRKINETLNITKAILIERLYQQVARFNHLSISSNMRQKIVENTKKIYNFIQDAKTISELKNYEKIVGLNILNKQDVLQSPKRPGL